ncbi:MAG: hypothetical protein N2745_03460 [Syntrophorhabdaceae bacterium]|nr:hypothetical protein [Syntrophorhabdaceae bacterium]
MEYPISKNTILIHLGGLGDICLSESTIHSLSHHFRGGIDALGNRRFLILFDSYFNKIYSIDSQRWLPLFKEEEKALEYERFIFIGKDREGRFIERLKGLSRMPPIFIDMFPGPTDKRIHVEDYQLSQLGLYSIEPKKIDIKTKKAERVILYPEVTIKKRKWPKERFLDLYISLESKGIPVLILCQYGMKIPVEQKIHIDELTEIRDFFSEGGVFVSNDSGIAHLAGLCGLKTVTIFIDSDPLIWHPRGVNYPITGDINSIRVEDVEERILEALSIA